MTLPRTSALILGTILTCGAEISLAFDMGNMMNPSKWMGSKSNRDNYDDGPQGGPGYGYGGPGGAYGGPGYGYRGPGGAYGGPGYGYRGPGGGYSGPVYGYGIPGGYGGPAGYAAPTGYGSPRAGAAEQSEIDALKERVRVLEGAGSR